jgi:membrane associated rhomboid family serine protease
MTPTPVGMRCPECARDRTKVKTVSSRQRPGTAVTLTQVLIVINVLVFLGETASGTPLGGATNSSLGTVFAKGALFGPYISSAPHQYYRLLTAGFLHDGLLHILFNMVFLYFMGAMLEPAIGKLNFGVVYFVTLLSGSFGALLFEPDVPTVGASTACFGVLGALIVVAYYRGISIWQSGLGITLLINIVFSLSISGISIGGHIGGVVGGAICGWLIVQLAERRRMQGAAIAACLLVAVISVVAAIAVGNGTGLTPNGVNL